MYLDTFTTGMREGNFVMSIWFLVSVIEFFVIVLQIILSNAERIIKWLFAIAYAMMEKK